MHKGFKCLDILAGRIYISRDVVFDETLFPFSKLHPNAGTHLRSEVLLLPYTRDMNLDANLFDDPSSNNGGSHAEIFDVLQHVITPRLTCFPASDRHGDRG
jgi:hypothetical protein